MPHTLLTLPPELRNRIYSYFLPNVTQEFRFSLTVFTPVPAILQVSRQARAEASGLYYRHCAFDLLLHHRGVWQFRAWIDSLPREASRHIRKNGNVNLRLVFDSHHGGYRDFKSLLGSYQMGSSRTHGWFTSAESRAADLGSVKDMVDIVAFRAMQGRQRSADVGLKAGKFDAQRAVLSRASDIHRGTEIKEMLRAAMVAIKVAVESVLKQRSGPSRTRCE